MRDLRCFNTYVCLFVFLPVAYVYNSYVYHHIRSNQINFSPRVHNFECNVTTRRIGAVLMP